MERKKEGRKTKKTTTHSRGYFLPWMRLEMPSVDAAAGATGYSISDGTRRLFAPREASGGSADEVQAH